ncbi:MAG: GAF domain-containing protein [Planctomycetota bacterium]
MTQAAAMTSTQTQAMTAAAEVWRVDAQEQSVTLIESVYLDAEALRPAGEGGGATLATGQGLAGLVLARRVPVLLNEPDAESFERVGPAADVGVKAVLGLPIFDEDKLTYVVVLMFRGSPGMVGAVELWAGRSGRFELGLAELFHSGLEHFAKVSEHVNFPMGSGLPGEVWRDARPRLMTGLGQSRGFLRSSGAETAGLTTGFGYPIIHRNELKAVMLWLSSAVSPLAAYQAVWRTKDGTAGALARWCDDRGVGLAHGAASSEAVPGAVLKAGSERRPVVFTEAGAGGAPEDAKVSAGLALPVFAHEKMRAVGVLAW